MKIAPLWVAAALVSGALAGCVSLAPLGSEPVSVGFAANGYLHRGVSLPNRGEGYVRARPGESTRYGTAELVGALERAAAEVARTFPNTAPLRIGDLSSPRGGRHPRHNSHRTGRDVDLIFYITDAMGRSVRGRGWLSFDRFGVARDMRAEERARAPEYDELFFLDVPRNWRLIRSLLVDEQARVQWIFVSRGVKARLLRYAAAHETDPDVLFRATWVIHQPTRGNPHADHFHVRLACSPEQRPRGCVDSGPIWPWFRDDTEKVYDDALAALTDEILVGALLGDEDGERLADRGATHEPAD